MAGSSLRWFRPLVWGACLAAGCGAVFGAGTCPNGNGNYLTGPQLTTLFGTSPTVCARSSATGQAPGWNEEHSGGNVNEWHSNNSADPKENGIGTYTITASVSGSAGTIRYSYGGGGGSFTYFVTQVGATTNYVYCQGVGNSAGSITVDIHSGYQALSTCPSN